jgi:hypothetical protein
LPKKKSIWKLKQKDILNNLFPIPTANKQLKYNIDYILKEELEKYIKEFRKGDISI